MNKYLKITTSQILYLLKIFSWFAVAAFTVELGAYLINTIVCYWTPSAAKNIYNGLNLFDLREESFVKYAILLMFMIVMNALKAIVWYMVAGLIGKIKLDNPFTSEVVHSLEYISLLLFAIWVFAVTGSGYVAWLGNLAGRLNDSWSHGEFFFMAGLVYTISQIFKRGVEIQSENELTV